MSWLSWPSLPRPIALMGPARAWAERGCERPPHFAEP